MKRIIHLIILPFLIITASAQEMVTNDAVLSAKTITNQKMVGVGYNALQDTYLSPEHYSGVELRYLSHTLRQKDSSRVSRLIINEGYISQCGTRSTSNNVLAAAYHFQYGALWQVLQSGVGQKGCLTLRAGGQAEALGGVIYNTRNSNNPAQMRALIDVGPVAMASLQLSRRITVDYEASCPLFGLTFSPNYTQLYYEIFSLGHYDHNIVPTTIVSTPSLRHQLSATFRFPRLSVTVGYLGDYRQQQVNDLKQHCYSSVFMIGLSRTIKVLSPR